MAQSTSIYFPSDFLDMIRDGMPQTLTLESFIEYSSQPLRRSIRVNTLKISVADFIELTTPYHWKLTPIPWCKEGFWIVRDDEDEVPLGSTAEHLSGLFYIQEASSMLPVSALFADDEPSIVMDMAAAPGSKTTQIAAEMDNQGAILANEYSASRVKVLHANISRSGITNVGLTHFDGCVFGAALPESFDAILLDAPCSGEGVIRKDPDALRNWSIESTEEIAQTQQALIESAFHTLRPGGVLVYSTCTLNKRENQQICHWLLDTYSDAVEIMPLTSLFPEASLAATEEGFLHVFPQMYDCEGFFVARFRKIASVPALPKPKYKLGKFPFELAKQNIATNIKNNAQKIGLVINDNLQVWLRDKEIWLFPQAITPLINQVRFSRIGIKLAEQHNKGFRWQHEAIVALAQKEGITHFALSAQEAEEWYRGNDIYPEVPPTQDDVIVTYQDQPLGIAKKIGSRLKNSYPRELVRSGKLFASHNKTE